MGAIVLIFKGHSFGCDSSCCLNRVDFLLASKPANNLWKCVHLLQSLLQKVRHVLSYFRHNRSGLVNTNEFSKAVLLMHTKPNVGGSVWWLHSESWWLYISFLLTCCFVIKSRARKSFACIYHVSCPHEIPDCFDKDKTKALFASQQLLQSFLVSSRFWE